MLRVFKYQLGRTAEFSIEMPQGARVLSVGEQGMEAFIWALVEAGNPLEPVDFSIRTTGADASGLDAAIYVGTFQVRHMGLVFHLWRRP
jgi:hypothetical protein